MTDFITLPDGKLARVLKDNGDGTADVLTSRFSQMHGTQPRIETVALDTPEAAWDSESRLSPFCTVWSPEQDDEDEWQTFYDAAITMGYDDLAATEYADSRSN